MRGNVVGLFEAHRDAAHSPNHTLRAEDEDNGTASLFRMQDEAIYYKGERDGAGSQNVFEGVSKPLSFISLYIGRVVREMNCIKEPSLHFVKRTKDELVPKGGDAYFLLNSTVILSIACRTNRSATTLGRLTFPLAYLKRVVCDGPSYPITRWNSRHIRSQLQELFFLRRSSCLLSGSSFIGLKGGAGSHQIGIQEEGFQEIGIFGRTHIEGPGLVERVQEVCCFRNIETMRKGPRR